MSAQFNLYGIFTGNVGPIPTEHTYVLSSDGHNWNCFGRYAGGRLIRTGTASSKWANMIYGPTETCMGESPAAGLRVRYDGVCQTAANRILVLVGDGMDTRGSQGNAFATLMYGKFGFNLQPYIENVRATGAQLLQTTPGEVTQADIDAVFGRITAGQTADAELDVLHTDSIIEEHDDLPDITDFQRNAFRPIYTDYQSERAAAFAAISSQVPSGANVEVEGQLQKALTAPWQKCVGRLVAAVGPDQFKMMFGLTSDIANQLFG